MTDMSARIPAIAMVGLLVAATLSAFVVFLIVASDEPEEEWFDANDTLQTFSSTGDLRDYLESTRSTIDLGSPSGTPTLSEDIAASGDSSYRDYSTTNIQVEGIDEHDIVKTDGEYIYLAHSTNVTILKAYPAESLSVVSTIEISESIEANEGDRFAALSGLYVRGDLMVVLVYAYEYVNYIPEDIVDVVTFSLVEEPGGPYTLAVLFDVSDPSEPNLLSIFGISGSLLGSRMKDGVVYLVTQQWIWWFPEEPVLPWVWNNDDGSRVSADSIKYDPESDFTESYLNILAVDTDALEMNHVSLLVSHASVMYMSHSGLYVTIPKWFGSVILSDDWLAPEEEDTARTSIYRIAINGLSMGVSAKGEVRGWLLSQFSMDESDSHLRVATTTSWLSPKNAVYILNSTLDVVGSVTDIAPDERIFAARFVGDKLYLVTFEQIDPLFVIDLSNPSQPTVLGELEVPGWSSYLHPIGENHVLGIGRENSTVKVSLYDVSDPTVPVEVDKLLAVYPGSSADDIYSWSQAEWDHKAVLYDENRGMLVLPISMYYGYEEGATNYWEGFFVFSVDVDSGISLEGMIEHPGVPIRALYIEDSLYTVSMTTVMISSLPDLDYQGSVSYYDGYYWYWRL